MKAGAQGPVSNFSATPTSGCGPLHVQFTDQSTNSPLFWNWDFGDGQSSTAQNPLNVYTNPGTYTVTLTTRNRDGANTKTLTGLITVYAYPSANFTSNLTVACAPSSVQFINTSSGVISSYEWDLGDGTQSTQPNPLHTYTQTGYYNISLTVSNAGGCSNISSQLRYLRVIDGIQPNFTFDQTSASCSPPYIVNFINQTAGPGTLTYNWSLGTGAAPAGSTDINPTNITYPGNGNYTVSLQVQSSLGCSQTFQKNIPFNGGNATFTAPGAVCINTPVTFTNTSTPTPLSSAWNFGDGTTGSGQNPSKTYTALGTFSIKVVNKNAACSDSLTKTISVVNPPTPNFSAPVTTGCQAPLTVNFQDNSTGSPNKWLWNFGDGHTDTVQNPTHTYTDTGSFNVTLTASSASGCYAPLTKNGFVLVRAPILTLGTDTLGACTSGTADNNTIKPILTVTSVDPASTYTWSAPSATPSSSTLQNPSFSYPGPGNYSISVTVKTLTGCTATKTFTNVVEIGTPVTPDFNISFTPTCGRTPVLFKSTKTPGQHWLYKFGDGSFSTGDKDTSSHTYQGIGDYQVTLTMTNNGCPQAITKPVHVNAPVAGFTTSIDCNGSPLSVTFNDTTQFGVTPPPTGTTWLWNFGDPASGANNVSSGQSPTHDYTAGGSGTYFVKLSVTDPATGCTDTTRVSLVVGPTIASFTPADLSSICKNTDNLLRSTSTNPTLIQSYSWSIDGGTPGGNTPTDTLNIPTTGPNTVSLTIVSIYGCTSTATNHYTVTGPTAAFSYPTPLSGGCKNTPVTFADNSTAYPGTTLIGWAWDWGDGNGSNFNTPPPPFQHAYTAAGNYSVKLTIQDNNGCFDAFREPGTILITSPVANFSGPDSFYCPGVPFTFIDSSKGYQLSDSWNFGDSQTGTTPTHTYTDNGNYSVTLTVTDTFSCTNTITKSVRIQKPIAAFDIADTVGICIPLQTQFTSQGQFYDSLYWNFGDGTTSTLPVTSHFYNSYSPITSPFIATLYLRGPGGCFETASRRVLLLDPDANSQFTYGPPLEACDSVPIKFNIVPPPYTSFEVLFGDNYYDSSQNPNPIHVYHNPNTYHPNLLLTDVTGCIYPIGGAQRITVLGASPFFSMNPHSFCDSAIVNMIDYTTTNDGIDSETYVFSDGSPSQLQTPGTGAFNVSNYFNKVGTWIVALKTVTDHECKETYTDTVRVYQTPHPLITVVSPLCNGLIQFQGSLDAPQVDTIGWTWNLGNGQTSDLQNPAGNFKPGNYTVTLRADVSFGCADTTSTNITVFSPPVIKGPKEITTPLGIPVTIPFTYSSNVVSYNWTPATNLDCATCANPVATLLLATQYAVTVVDTNKCTATDSILIKTICNDQNFFLPNTFSPNGDGVNDYFYPRGTNLYNVQSLTIFNRWGQQVFQRRDFPANAQNMGWDGTFNGHPAPADAYVFIVEMICENAQVVAIHGSVTLVR